MNDLEKAEIKQNKAIRGYIIRCLVKGYNNTALTRQLSNAMIAAGLIISPDIIPELACNKQLFTRCPRHPDSCTDSDFIVIYYSCINMGIACLNGMHHSISRRLSIRYLPGAKAYTGDLHLIMQCIRIF